MKSRINTGMVEAFTSGYGKLEEALNKLKYHVLDNECLRVVQQFLIKKGVTTQNIEAHNHEVNSYPATGGYIRQFIVPYCSPVV
jgi:hypothetical protein